MPKVKTASFVPFNNVALDPAIRIFGLNNPTVAQDLEPEYITVSQDSKTAWVTLQENNALAIIDIPSATVKKLVPLGYKDHAAVDAATTLYNFDPAQLPAIGTTLAGQEIPLGGFSGLAFEGIDPVTGRYKFAAHTDRGPNAEPTGILRPFLLPQFAPEVVRFELDRQTGKLTLTAADSVEGLQTATCSPACRTPRSARMPASPTTTRCPWTCSATCCRSTRSVLTWKASCFCPTVRSGCAMSIARRCIISTRPAR
jgi:hypothetical protein